MGNFIGGFLLGSFFFMALAGLHESILEKNCRELHNVYDCNLKAEPYEPASKDGS